MDNMNSMMNNMNGMNPMMNNMNGMNPMMNNMNGMNQMMNNMNGMNPMMNQMMMNQMMNNPMFMSMMNQMMMNQMMMNNQMTGMNIDSQDPNAWNIIFEKKNGAQNVTIKAKSDDLVKSIINKYKIKENINNDEEIKFIFNGKSLNFDLSLSQAGLQNLSRITVLTTGDVEGA